MRRKNHRKEMEKDDYRNILTRSSSSFMTSEAYKTVRTNLLYSSKGEKCPVFAVTSTAAHSGKSVLFANLAISFSQLGKKVLLMDLDMRSPVQHRIFHCSNRYGSSEILAGISAEGESAVSATPYENLFLVTSGRIPPNPSELLASRHLTDFLQTMKEQFDYIFLDFPPVGVVSDALIVADQVTGYVYAVRADYDDIPGVEECLQRMKQADAAILGLVLNDVPCAEISGYGKNNRNYRYRYGNYTNS